MFFEQYGLNAELVDQTLNRIFTALQSDPAAYLENEFIQDSFGASASVEALGDGSYRIEETTSVGVSVGLTVSCTPYADGIPFDLSQKNACTTPTARCTPARARTSSTPRCPRWRT